MLAKMLMGGGGAASAVQIRYVGGYATSVTPSTTDQTITFGGNLTGGLSSSASAGDLVVVYYTVSAGLQFSQSITGYTTVASLYVNGSTDTNLLAAYKVMGGTPDSTLTLVGGTGATTRGGAVAIQVFRNVDSILPLDVAATTSSNTTSVLADPPSITPSTAGAVIVAGGGGAHARGIKVFSSSDLTNFIGSGSTDTSTDATVGMGYKAWTSGAFDPAAFTFNGVDDTLYSSGAVTLALRPPYSGTKPTFIASASTQNTATGATLVVNKPSGTLQGDLMVAVMAGGTGSTTTWTGDTGWTEVADLNTKPSLRLAYKVAGSSEPSSYTFTASGSGNNNSGCILTYRNAAYDTIGAFVTGTTPAPAPSITAAAAYSVLIAAYANGATSRTCTTPTDMTARVTDNDATTPSYLVADQYVIAGATGTRTSDIGTISNGGAGILMSIKPA